MSGEKEMGEGLPSLASILNLRLKMARVIADTRARTVLKRLEFMKRAVTIISETPLPRGEEEVRLLSLMPAGEEE